MSARRSRAYTYARASARGTLFGLLISIAVISPFAIIAAQTAPAQRPTAVAPVSQPSETSAPDATPAPSPATGPSSTPPPPIADPAPESSPQPSTPEATSTPTATPNANAPPTEPSTPAALETPAPTPSNAAPTPTPDATSAPGATSAPDASSSPTPAETPAGSAASSDTVDYLVTFASDEAFTARAALLVGLGLTERDAIPALRMVTVSAPAASAVVATSVLRLTSGVARVETEHDRTIEADPNDALYADQWALPRIGWPAARGAGSPSGTAVVAVLDTGVDGTHPDLAGQLVPGATFAGDAAADSDPNGHGTQMAGIVAALADNLEGIAGVAFDGVQIMPVTVLGADGTGADGDIIAGLVWAVDHGADVVLMSFSSTSYSPSLQAALDYAWGHDVVLVAATGNDASTVVTYPAGDRGVIGVSNTDQNDALFANSNSGADVFLAAPGEAIVTITAGGSYLSVTGTSASAAMVAGAAGMLRAFDPAAANGQIVYRLAVSADDVASVSDVGNGRLDLAGALAVEANDSVQPAGAGVFGDGGPIVPTYVSAATSTWTGAASNLWNTAGNWSPSGVPAAGSDLVFPSGALNLAMSNDIAAGRSFNSTTFTGSGYSVTGNSITLAGSITDSVTGGSNSMAIAIATTAVQTVTVSDSGHTLTLSAIISGTGGGISKAGSGTLSLNGANTMTGGITVSAGTLGLGNATAPGTGDVTLSGGTLLLSTAITVAGSWTNNGGTLSAASNTVTFSGTTKTIGGTTATTFAGLTVTTGSITMNNNNSATAFTLANNNVANSFTHGSGAALTVNGSVTINQASGGAVVHAWNINAGSATVTGSVTISVTANIAGRVAKIVTTTGTLTVQTDLIVTNAFLAANGLIDMSGGAGRLEIGGVFTVNTLATLTPGTSSTVAYKGAGAQTVTFTSAVTYNTVEVAKSSGTLSLAVATSVTNVVLTQGTFSASASNFDLTVAGDWTNNGGSYSGGTSTVTFTGSAGAIGGASSTAFPAVSFSAATAVAYTVSGTSSATSLTIGNAANSLAVTMTHASGSTFSVSGAVTLNQPSGGATRAWQINAATVTVSGLMTFGGSSTSTNRIFNVVITSGTLNANGGLTFVASAAVTKVIDMSGGAGTLNLKGALTVPAASSTLTAGTAGSTFVYADTVAQTINYFSAGAYHNLHVSNSSAGGATLSAAITTGNVTGNLRVLTGSKLDTSTFVVTGTATKTIEVQDGATLRLGGTTAFPTGFTTVTLGGASNNSTIEFYGGAQNVAATATLVTNYDNLILSGTAVTKTLLGDLTADALLTVNSSATFALSNKNVTVGSLTGNGTIATGNGAVTNTFNVGSDGTSTTFSGVFSSTNDAADTIVKTGAGTLTLSVTNTFTGTLKSSAGSIRVDGTLAGTSTATIDGGRISGTGTAGIISATANGGQLSPGSPSTTTGILNAGNSTLASASTYVVQINGTTAASGYDQLNVTGAVALGSSTLSLSLGYSPSAGDSYTIIANDGADAVTGTFNGQAEGSSITVSGVAFTVTYIGGTGNDVVLTVATVTDTWTGAVSSAWSVAGNWQDNRAPATGHALVFPAGATSFTPNNDIAAATTFASVTISTSGYTISGNSITLGSGGLAASNSSGSNTVSLAVVLPADRTVTVTNGSATLTLSGVVSGSFALTKAGSGTLVLSGTNTYVATTISAGTLQIGAAGTTGTLGSGAVTDNGTLAFNRTDTWTVGNTISGSGTVTKIGSGNLTLSGSNSFTGSTTISAGTLNIAADNNLGTAPGSPTAGQLAFNGGTVATTATFTLNSNRGIAFSSTGTIDVAASTTLTYGGIAAGANGLTKTSTGTLTLSGSNTYSGATTINAGTLSVAADANLGTAPGSPTAGQLTFGGGTLATTATFTLDSNRGIAFSSTGTIDVAASTTLTYGGIAAGANGLTKTNTGTLVLSGANTYTTTTISAGTLQVGAAGTSGTLGSGAVTDNAALAFNRSDSVTVSNVIGGSGTVTQSGAGTMTLSGSNSYAGATTINAGTLSIAADTNLGTAPGSPTAGQLTFGGGTLATTATFTLAFNRGIAFSSAGTIDVAASTTLTYGGSAAGASGLIKTNTGTLVLTGANTYTTTTISAGTLQIGAASTSGTLGSGAVTDNAALVFNRSDSITVSNVIGGSGTVAKSAAGTLTLSGSNTYSGATTINAGTLSIAADANLGTAPGSPTAGQLTFGGGTLATTATFTLNSNRGIAFGSTGTIDVAASTTLTYGGIAAGANGLTKTSTGTLTLSGANTYSGATTVNAGTLSFAADNNLGTAPGSPTAGQLTFGGGTLATTATFTLNSNRGIAFSSTGAIDVAASTTLTYGGIAAGANGLTKTSTGTLTLSGANTYSGATTVNAGTLSIAADANLGTAPGSPTAGQLTFGGGTLATTATFTLNSNRGIAFGSTGTIDVAASTTLTYGGIAAGANGLTKTSTGTLTLSGANSYTGTTTISAGTVLVNGSQGGSAVSVNGGTLGGNGTVGTITSTASGGSLAPGSAGSAIINGGNLNLSAAGTRSVAIELNSTTAGSGYDQVNITGTVNLTGATLSGTVGFTPVGGNTFTIVNNDGADAVTGTFSGLAEGANVTLSGFTFSISYVGGTGNDVVLTKLASLSGNVFEDFNYGGGAGRTKAASSGSGRTSARVELYTSGGVYSTFTTTDGSGNFTFSAIAVGTYYIRIVNSSVTSSRTGYTSSALAVQTYRTDATSGSPASVTDYVGGTNPSVADPGDGSAGATFNTSTFVYTAVLSGTAQSVTKVVTSTTDITGLDFGFNFDSVVNVNDSGQGSLRQFIANANLLANAGLVQAGRPAAIDNAIFMISNGTAAAGLRSANNYFSGGVATVSPASALPTITEAIVLDAQTQPGWSTVPIIQLTGTSAGVGAKGLYITAGGSTVRGLVINAFTGSSSSAAIWIATFGGNTVQGNYLGTNAAGSAASANYQGIYVDTTTSGNSIGGTSATQRNVISGNTWRGIYLDNGASGNTIKGNYVGLDAAGTSAIANNLGISIWSSPSNTIGGTGAGEGNVISGNTQMGIYLVYSGSSGNTIQGNTIGLNAARSAAVANGAQGIEICCGGDAGSNNTIGGTAAGAANVISGNTGKGVRVLGGTGNGILTNAIYGNGSIGIELGTDGVTANNGTKNGALPNSDMDFPVFTSAVLEGTTLIVVGYVGSAPSQSLFASSRVEVFKSDKDASGNGEGRTYLGYLTADASGNLSGSIAGVSGLAVGDSITATASDASNNTSEFSLNQVVAWTAYVSASSWPTSANASRYLSVAFPAYLPSSATVHGATFSHNYRSYQAVGTTCYYIEVYAGASLIGTHGSAGSPISCQSGSTYASDQVSLGEVNTAARANTLSIRLIVWNSSGVRSEHRLAKLTVDYHLD